MFSTDGQAETCRQHTPPPPPHHSPPAASWPGVLSWALYLQEEQWVSCLHAAPPATPPPVERAAVSGDFSLQLLSHAPSWMGSVMLESASPYLKIHLAEGRHPRISSCFAAERWRGRVQVGRGVHSANSHQIVAGATRSKRFS